MIKKVLSLCAAFSLGASAAGAQQTTAAPIEIGADAGLSVGFDTPQVTVISIPVQAVRFGFYVNDKVSVEPKVAFNLFHSDGVSFTQYGAQVGLLYHFQNNPIGRGLYVRPFAGFTGESGGGTSETQGIVGAGFGAKVPFADRFATRMEIGYQHLTAPSGGSSQNDLLVLFGLSVFTH